MYKSEFLSPACIFLAFYIETPNDKEAGGAWLVIQVGATCYKEATAGDTVEEAFMVFFLSLFFCEV